MQKNKMLLGLGLFDCVVGQEAAKKRIWFYLESYLETKIFPNMLFVAPKGCGKTTIAKETAKGLIYFNEDGQTEFKEDGKSLKKKTFVEVNCSSIKSVAQFVNGFYVPYIQDKDVTVLFDEASEISNKVAKFLLSALNPNPDNRNTVVHDEYVCEFDFRRCTFIFATNEIQKVDPALIDRLKRIDLEEYTHDQLGTIVKKAAKEVTFKDDVLMEVSKVLRGNARAAMAMANDIKSYLKGRTTFGMKDWTDMREILSIHPLGVSELELTVLRYLAGRPDGMSLTCLSSKVGMSTQSLQRDVELYLMRHNLMEVTTGGRIITALGLAYLKALDQKIPIESEEDLKKIKVDGIEPKTAPKTTKAIKPEKKAAAPAITKAATPFKLRGAVGA